MELIYKMVLNDGSWYTKITALLRIYAAAAAWLDEHESINLIQFADLIFQFIYLILSRILSLSLSFNGSIAHSFDAIRHSVNAQILLNVYIYICTVDGYGVENVLTMFHILYVGTH